MKWVTRERVKVDRVACPWIVRRFIDPEADFLFVPAATVLDVAQRQAATPFDFPGVELGHHGGHCSFEAFLTRFGLTDPALMLLAQIVHGADLTRDLYGRPEAAGLKAIAEGFRHLDWKDDHEILEREAVVYDALYAYCQQLVAAQLPPAVCLKEGSP